MMTFRLAHNLVPIVVAVVVIAMCSRFEVDSVELPYLNRAR